MNKDNKNLGDSKGTIILSVVISFTIVIFIEPAPLGGLGVPIFLEILFLALLGLAAVFCLAHGIWHLLELVKLFFSKEEVDATSNEVNTYDYIKQQKVKIKNVKGNIEHKIFQSLKSNFVKGSFFVIVLMLAGGAYFYFSKPDVEKTSPKTNNIRSYSSNSSYKIDTTWSDGSFAGSCANGRTFSGTVGDFRGLIFYTVSGPMGTRESESRSGAIRKACGE